jgi:hypothetical protein
MEKVGIRSVGYGVKVRGIDIVLPGATQEGRGDTRVRCQPVRLTAVELANLRGANEGVWCRARGADWPGHLSDMRCRS